MMIPKEQIYINMVEVQQLGRLMNGHILEIEKKLKGKNIFT